MYRPRPGDPEEDAQNEQTSLNSEWRPGVRQICRVARSRIGMLGMGFSATFWSCLFPHETMIKPREQAGASAFPQLASRA